MTDGERRRKDGADRVTSFFNTEPNPDDPQSKPRREDFAPASKTTVRIAELETLTGNDGRQGLIDDAIARQHGGAGSGEGKNDAKSVIADGLRSDLADITRTARELEDEVPGITAKFPPPENAGYTALRIAVLTHLENLTPEIKSALVAEELPGDFEEQLREDLESFDAAEDDEDTALDTQVRGTESLGRLLRRADTLTRKLNASVATNTSATSKPSAPGWSPARSSVPRRRLRRSKP